MSSLTLNTVPSQGTFGNAVNEINTNFSLVKTAIGEVEYETRKNKGLFATSTALTAAIPHPEDGDWALVGDGFPADIYVANNGSWSDSGNDYDGDNVDLNDYVTKTEFDTLASSAVGSMDAGGTVNYLGFNIVFVTQEQYNAMESHDNGTLYFIGSNVNFSLEQLVRITESEFDEITPDNNTIYLITAD